MPDHNEFTFHIEDGSPKELLLPQLADIGRVSIKDRPWFNLRVTTIAPGSAIVTDLSRREIGVLIDGLKADGVLGSLWKIEGRLHPDFRDRLQELTRGELESPAEFKGHYDTRNRSGYLTFKVKPRVRTSMGRRPDAARTDKVV